MLLEFAAKGEMYKIMSKLPDGKWEEQKAAKVSLVCFTASAFFMSVRVV